MNDIKQLITILTDLSKEVSIISKNIAEMRSADAIRNLALSNFVTEQEKLNKHHDKRIEELSDVASTIEAIGQLNKKINKN
tara:strand:+ start:274 stop:516 length:243 start_codon:yes stop_codon:yes gene_type:complete